MRKITADYIFPVSGMPIKNGIIVFDDHGKILSVEHANSLKKSEIECFKGIIVPGFVNAHTHLELAHTKGMIEQGIGVDNFIVALQKKRNEPIDRLKCIKQADGMMYRNGIVAAGDISNEHISFDVKAYSKIKYHTFVELFGLEEEKAKHVFDQATALKIMVKEKYALPASLSPHAPYSLSKRLFMKIKQYTEEEDATVSMHNQESEEENKLFRNKSGAFIKAFEKLNVSFFSWKETGMNSLQSVFPYLASAKTILLVHNTYTKNEDIEAINCSGKIYWVLAPNANLFIEGRLPDIPMFIRKKQKIAIGTDSYASNGKLCVLEELKTITSYFPDIPLKDLIEWATLNGAKALNFDNYLGSFDKGKMPGINLISNIDLSNLKLTRKSSIRKII